MLIRNTLNLIEIRSAEIETYYIYKLFEKKKTYIIISNISIMYSCVIPKNRFTEITLETINNNL